MIIQPLVSGRTRGITGKYRYPIFVEIDDWHNIVVMSISRAFSCSRSLSMSSFNTLLRSMMACSGGSSSTPSPIRASSR